MAVAQPAGEIVGRVDVYTDITQARAAARIMEQLYTAFVNNGASLAEINPLVTTPDGRVLALDAKIVIDDNELFWRPDLGVLRDDSAEEPSEAAARRANLSFIQLAEAVLFILSRPRSWRVPTLVVDPA